MTEATPEVVVVGAGPAGAATATLLARAGHQVVLLDRARFPRPKVCGEYLSPEGLRILDRLGALEPALAAGARPLRGMRIVAPGGAVLLADYPRTGPWRGFRDHGLSVRRTLLDALLVERARAAGVTVREGFRVTDVVMEGQAVVGVEGLAAGGGSARLRSALVVGADGRTSVVARRLGLVRPHRWLRRLALTADLRAEIADPERAEVLVAPPAYAILNPVGEALINASLVVPLGVGSRHTRDREAFFEAGLAAIPGLGPRIRHACRAGPVRALGPLAYRVTPPRRAGVLLVGDALGFLDPFTGEGLHTALRSAELAAEVAHAALLAGDVTARALAPAHRHRRAELAGKGRLAALLQVVIGSRRLADLAARHLRDRPAALGPLMGVLGDFVPARALARPGFLAHLLGPPDTAGPPAPGARAPGPFRDPGGRAVSPPEAARARLAALAAAADRPGALAEAALLIAAEEYPDLVVADWQERLAALGRRAAERITPEMHVSAAASALRRLLADEEGFRGNAEDYYDPRNSFLNDVLDRRLGIPITLSLVYMDTGARAGLTVRGIGLPGHFVVLAERNGDRRLLDPFHGGRPLDEAGCAALLARVHGPGARLRPEHLAPVAGRHILMRMLANLKGVYTTLGDARRALAAVDRLVLLAPEARGELRDRGQLHLRLGHRLAAIGDFEAYLSVEPPPPGAAEVLRQLRALRQALGSLN